MTRDDKIALVKEMEQFAEKYSADPDEVLPEAGTLETGKSYREKNLKPPN